MKYQKAIEMIDNAIFDYCKYNNLSDYKEDVVRMTSVLHQQLNEDFEEVVDDIVDKKTYMIVRKVDLGDLRLEIKIHVECEPYYYHLFLETEEKDIGYCECEEGDKDYDVRYDCCGHNCDWIVPTFAIHKTESLGSRMWKGDEHDLWDYVDSFNDVKEIEKEKLESKRARLIDKIERLQNELENLENN